MENMGERGRGGEGLPKKLLSKAEKNIEKIWGRGGEGLPTQELGDFVTEKDFINYPEADVKGNRLKENQSRAAKHIGIALRIKRKIAPDMILGKKVPLFSFFSFFTKKL